VFLVFSVVIILSSAIFANKGQQFLGFFLVGVFALTLALAHFNLAGFLIDSLEIGDRERGIFEGDQNILFHVVIKPAAVTSFWRLISRGKTDLNFDESNPIRLEQVELNFFVDSRQRLKAKIPDLDLGSPKRVELWASSELQRGKHRVTQVEISTTYPFGLFRAWRRIKVRQDFWVFPRPYPPVIEIKALSGTREEQNEMFATSLGGLDFQGIQEVLAFDSPRKLIPQQDPLRGTWLIKKFSQEDPSLLRLDWSKQACSELERLGTVSALALYAEEFEVESPYYLGRIKGPEQKFSLLKKLAEVAL
jgi:hypothetical protein